jgi:hypothetical protein
MAHTWLRSWSTLPDPDELVLVALYAADGALVGYELCRWVDGEWQDGEGDGSWPRLASCAYGRPVGLLWRYFEAATEHANDIAGRVAA